METVTETMAVTETVFDYLLDNKILDKGEFVDYFSVRSIKLNNKVLCDPQTKIEKGEKITIGFRDIIVE